ncbi:MAG: glycosyltransferase family 2 protein [Synergistetes bacterium]|nr:glycosyltransferase family 2 protein [Synergistota bacterium]MCX8127377.1 glycosyltransferase family 2 protein [Synergistota bacterium]MDW8192241.1 glycosyltransferase family 2 protein [Synergistota bacterium]
MEETLYNYILFFLQTFTALVGGYYVVIYTLSFLPWKEKKSHAVDEYLRFVILIPAHNEEKVVGKLISNLRELDYPKELYKIVVIADNCTDNTAKVAREAGAMVWERTDSKRRGKQYALDWAFRKLLKRKEFDAVCVFDADNLVSLNFLKKVNERMLSGEKVLQCYLDTKNPFDSWITKAYALGYWISNRVFQFARWRTGLSAVLGGTGFAISMDLIKKYALGLSSLTEDLELTMRLNLAGIKVGWIHDAKVYDEKPLTFKESWNQRLRWMRGHWDVAVRYGLLLFKKAIFEGKFYMLDMFFYAISPLRILLGGVILFFLFFSHVAEVDIERFSYVWVFPFWFWFLMSLWIWLYPFVAMVQEKVPIRAFPYFIYLFLWSLTWIPLVAHALLTFRVKQWSHTRHTRALTLEEVSQA